MVARPPQIGGQDVVVLSRGRSGTGKTLEFLSATMLPGRGMNSMQISAWIPGRGETNLLASSDLEEVANLLNSDPTGNKSFSLGGAFLVPFANRIVGKLTHGGNDLEFEWHDKKMVLHANWIANNDGVPMAGHKRHAIHGLILAEKTDSISTQMTADGESFTGVLHAGNWGGHWFSGNDVAITATLSGPAIDYEVTVRNVGKLPEPVGIGWHPYFSILSGDRSNVLVHIPAEDTAEVNNYDDVFPTGRLMPVAGTSLDFNAPGGAKLPNKLVDDSFTDLRRQPDRPVVIELRDPAAKYGLRMICVSPQIQTVQMYAPPEKKFVAIEPQYNLGDPFGKEWKGRDTGMVTLKPGEQTTWHVRLELFVP